MVRVRFNHVYIVLIHLYIYNINDKTFTRTSLIFLESMLLRTGDIIPEYPLPVVSDDPTSTIALPGHLTLLNSGLVEAFEFVTTGPGSLTIKVYTM